MSAMPITQMPSAQPISTLHTWLTHTQSLDRHAPRHAVNRVLHGPASNFKLCEAFGSARLEAETFIRDRYAQSFAARIDTFMPRLFCLRGEDDSLLGAFGLRAAQGPLYLERYLATSVDQAIAMRASRDVRRALVVEVGHFCGIHAGTVRAMICMLTSQLYQEGFAWVVFTGTTHLRNAFSRMGLSPLDLGVASPACLTHNERMAWGSYYEHAPHVLAGNIVDGHHALEAEALCRTGATQVRS